MKGKRKNKLNGFHKGLKPHNKGVKRALLDESEDVAKFRRISREDMDLLNHGATADEIRIIDSDEQECSARFLRPARGDQQTPLESAQKEKMTDPELNTYRLWHAKKTQDM